MPRSIRLGQLRIGPSAFDDKAPWKEYSVSLPTMSQSTTVHLCVLSSKLLLSPQEKPSVPTEGERKIVFIGL